MKTILNENLQSIGIFMVGIDSAIWTALIFDRNALGQCFSNRKISCDLVPFAQEIFSIEIRNRICSENSYRKRNNLALEEPAQLYRVDLTVFGTASDIWNLCEGHGAQYEH